MYQVLIDIHNYRQLLKVDPAPVTAVTAELERQAGLFGASFHELAQGRIMLGFPIHRPGDSAFVVDSVLGIKQYLIQNEARLAGFSIILESGDLGMESERVLGQLLVRATDDESLWLGPSAANTLTAYLTLEPRHGIWRVSGKNENLTPDLDISTALFDDFLPMGEFREFLDRSLTADGEPVRVLAVPCEAWDAAGDLVNASLNSRLGKDCDNQFIWILGQSALDPTPIALTRTLFPQNGAELGAMLDDTERGHWARVSRFLFQNAVSTVSGVPCTTISTEYPDELFRQAWRLYILALARRCARAGRELFIHVENHHLLSSASQDLLRESASWVAAQGACRVVIILSASQLDELPDTLEASGVFTLAPLDWEELGRKGLHREGLDECLHFIRQTGRLTRRHAACLQFLQHRAATQADARLRLAELTGKLRDRPAERLLVKLVIASCDDLLQEVCYALVITFGLLPLSLLFDFLSYLSIERIRHPAIIQGLFRHGLIRQEELVIPAFPHCADEIAELLGDKTVEIQSRLDNFLSLRLRERRLSLNMDLFSLVSELAEPDNFHTICFRYAQELLNAGLLDQTDRVLDCASTRMRDGGTSLQRKRLQYAVGYLNSRSLLLRDRSAELQVASSQLNSLTELPDDSITAYITLQKARIHVYQGEIEQALREVKQAVMLFQEMNDYAGLADSHILFGQILLAKERLIEARDYFILARNNATRTASIYQDIMSGLYDIVVVFLLGYHSRTLEALKDIQGILELARQNGFFSQVCFLEFLRGRVWFELGSYAQARSAFADALAICQAYPNLAARVLIKRWMARCDLFGGDAETGDSVLASLDTHRETLLFRAEACLIREDHAAALDLLERVLSQPRPGRAMHPERLAWEDGYANLEGRVIPLANHQDAITNLAICYRAWCQSRTGHRSDGIDTLFSFTRDKKRSTQDPNNHVYFLLYGLTLGKGPSEAIDDCATILGKAVKYLQERSSRIEEPAHKQSFLKSSFWNRRLLAEAKTYNLA